MSTEEPSLGERVAAGAGAAGVAGLSFFATPQGLIADSGISPAANDVSIVQQAEAFPVSDLYTVDPPSPLAEIADPFLDAVGAVAEDASRNEEMCETIQQGSRSDIVAALELDEVTSDPWGAHIEGPGYETQIEPDVALGSDLGAHMDVGPGLF